LRQKTGACDLTYASASSEPLAASLASGTVHINELTRDVSGDVTRLNASFAESLADGTPVSGCVDGPPM
jgi:hypothetical protein